MSNQLARYPHEPLPQGARIVGLGGGELGYMVAEALKQLGYGCVGYDPNPTCTLSRIAKRMIVGKFDSVTQADELASAGASAFLEIESISPKLLEHLGERIPVFPSPQTLHLTCDRLRQKQWLAMKQISIVPYYEVSSEADIHRVLSSLGGRAILKTLHGAYNGNGQVRLSSYHDIHDAFVRLGKQPCTLEKTLDLRCELCVIVVRDPKGQTVVYEPALTYHHPELRIMEWAVIPAPLPKSLLDDAKALALDCAQALDVVGVLAVELFVVGDTLYVNECAARPHNGGHVTRIGCVTSQFEQVARIATGHGLGSPKIHASTATAMFNLLSGMPEQENIFRLDFLNASDDVWYFKEPRVWVPEKPPTPRKMGHVACQAKTPLEALMAAAWRHSEVCQDSCRNTANEDWLGEFFEERQLHFR